MKLSGDYSDWVELKNVSDAPILLGEYYLTDRADETPERAEAGERMFQLPDEVDGAGAFFAAMEQQSSS